MTASNSNMALLMIAYKFPPMQSVSCNRTWAIYNGMQEYFDQVHVVSTSNRHVLPQDDMDMSAASVEDARTVDYRTLMQHNGRTSVAGEKAKTSVLGKTAARLQSSFPTLYLFGEGNLLYIRNAIRVAEDLLRKYPITHLFSTFPPYADHLIAASLKLRHPELFWIADFRDLHVDPAQDNLFLRSYQQSKNRRILKGADLVTTVSEGLTIHLREFHPHVRVLHNGIRESSRDTLVLYPKFTIAYTGSMFQDKRRPDTLLAALQRLLEAGTIPEQDVELVYAGKDSAVWDTLVAKYALGHIFRDLGLLARSEAEIIQRRSHVNVLLTYSTAVLKGNLTGKMYDYLAARRPLLVLINGPEDIEIEKLMRDTRAGRVVYHEEIDRTVEYLADMYHQWKTSPALTQEYDETVLQKLMWPAVLSEFMAENAMGFR